MGLDPQKDVNIISVGDAGLRMDQLRLGVIDATVLTAPYCFIAERADFKSLGSSKDTLSLPAIGIVTLERKINERPDQVKKVLRTVLKSLRFLRENLNDWNVLNGWNDRLPMEGHMIRNARVCICLI